MRSSKSRSRSKSNRQRSLGNIVNRVFDSSGPEGKVRGTPQQIIDKYLMLARDAQLSNDRVAEQNFLQHAEHYTRMLGEAQRELAREQEMRQGPSGGPNGPHGQGGQPGRFEPREDQRDRDAYDTEADQGLRDAPEDEGPDLVETPEARGEQPRRDDRRDDRRGNRGDREPRRDQPRPSADVPPPRDTAEPAADDRGEPARAERTRPDSARSDSQRSDSQRSDTPRAERGPRRPRSPKPRAEGPDTATAEPAAAPDPTQD